MDVREQLEKLLACGFKASKIASSIGVSESLISRFRKEKDLKLNQKNTENLTAFLKLYEKLINY